SQPPEWRNVQDFGAPEFAEAVNFINQLLEKNPETRLGSNSYTDIRDHGFFSSINFDNLMISDRFFESRLLEKFLERKKSKEAQEAQLILENTNYVQFEDIQDMPSDSFDSSQRLYTFLSKQFKEIVHRVKKNQNTNMDLTFSPPSPLTNYQNR